MNQQQFDQAADVLEAAISDNEGCLLPITRIEFELLAHQLRWTIWQDRCRLYVGTGSAADVDGLLTATRTLLKIRMEQIDPQPHEVQP